MSATSGSWATLAVNISDFSRYAKDRPDGKDNKAQYIQLPFLPLVFTLCGVIGIITTSASKVVYGEFYWNPLDIIYQWLSNGHGGRAAAFFASLSWYIAQVGTNITANSISAANDLTVLCPKYINIKRGCIVASIISGWAIVPWKILASASTFLSFMGGYAMFLGPISGIMASDYWLVKKRKINVPSLYDPHGIYRYWYGINWRAAVAFIVPVSPLLPGLANSINATNISAGAKHLYSFDWLFGFVVSIILYTSLSLIFPHKESLAPHTVYSLDTIEGKSTSPDRDVELESYGVHEKSHDDGHRKVFGNVDAVEVGKGS